MIKTFRGLLASGGQDRIRLSTIKGKVGYRIVKLQVIAKVPGTTSHESIVKIYNDLQSTVDGVINFTANDLLGAAYAVAYAAQFTYMDVIVFDREIFNQDIYITNSDVSGNTAIMNYYLELEVIPLDDAGAEYTTLKDMRST